MNSEEISELVKFAQENNKKLDITGMLLYQNRTFVQLLEGEKDVVLALYEKIQQDERHTRVETFWEQEIEVKSFAKWSMALADLSNARDFDQDVLSTFMQEGFTDETMGKDPSVGQELLLGLRSSL